MHCTGCGYDLKAHSSGEKCPECGLDVAVSERVLRERTQPVNVFGSVVQIAAGVVLALGGSMAWFYIFGNAFFGDPNMLGIIVFVGIAPPLPIGVVCAMIWKRRAWVWATLYSWPMLAWGLLTAPWSIIEGKPGLLIWLGFGVAMALLGAGGAWIGRKIAVRQWWL